MKNKLFLLCLALTVIDNVHPQFSEILWKVNWDRDYNFFSPYFKIIYNFFPCRFSSFLRIFSRLLHFSGLLS